MLWLYVWRSEQGCRGSKWPPGVWIDCPSIAECRLHRNGFADIGLEHPVESAMILPLCADLRCNYMLQPISSEWRGIFWILTAYSHFQKTGTARPAPANLGKVFDDFRGTSSVATAGLY
jgi:hypothetical protein